MYHVAICDDEPLYLHYISRMMGEIMIKNHIPYTLQTFRSARELLDYMAINPRALDLILLDILLGHENGIEFAANLRKSGNNVGIIFITSSSDYLLDGYTVEPIGYVLKSSESSQLEETLLRAYKKFQNQSIIIQTVNSTTAFRSAEVLYVEVNNKQLTVHLNNGKNELLNCPLNILADNLPIGQFFQCHRSYIIALHAIRSIRKYEITVKSGEKIPVSRSRYQDLQDALINWTADS